MLDRLSPKYNRKIMMVEFLGSTVLEILKAVNPFTETRSFEQICQQICIFMNTAEKGHE